MTRLQEALQWWKGDRNPDSSIPNNYFNVLMKARMIAPKDARNINPVYVLTKKGRAAIRQEPTDSPPREEE